MSELYYTGVGARKTPEIVREIFQYLGETLANKGYVLRSGGCEGADVAFESGCDFVCGDKDIYLPWKGYNNHPSGLYTINPDATEIAKRLHPVWDRVDDHGVKYLSRDVCQVLGQDLDKPSEFVICYTPQGYLVGGTAMAIRVANERKIKVFNAGLYDVQSWTKKTSVPRSKFVEEVLTYADARRNG